MTSNDPLARLMERAVDGLEPPTDQLIRGGLDRGRRLRRKRRMVQAASGTALVGLIAAVTVSIVSGSSSTALRERPATQTSAARQPQAPRPQRHSDPERVAMSPQLLVKTAVGLLPRKGTITHMTGRAMAGTVLAEFVYDDGNGPAQVDVGLGFEQDGANGVGDDCRPNDPNSTETCTIGSDGSHLATFSGTEYTSAHDPNATEYAAHLVRPDGVEIDIAEWNAPQEKDAAVSRPAPPFTISELVAFDRDVAWTPWVTPADNAAVAGLFVPDYTYDRRAELKQRELEAAAAAQAAELRARAKAQRESAHAAGH